MKKSHAGLLLPAILLFILTLFGLFKFDVFVNIILITLHSILLIVMCWLNVSECSETVEDASNDDEFEELQRKNIELKSMLQISEKNVQEKDEALTGLREFSEKLGLEKESLENEIIELKRTKSELEKELEEKTAVKAPAKAEPDLSSLLPPISESETATVDIITIAGEAVKELTESARDAGLAIHISTAAESMMVKASPTRMRILFKNIIDNSIKYMKRAGSLTITISNIGSDIFIVMKDTGEGLSETETDRIFELNYQGANRISGNGLGLTQARAIVNYYGGTIYARSNVGAGMAIYIQLPTT
ncbi:MAG: HAMP domain-containing histidine kinase [Lachnospiraceae bacterium]|nr:HAMP domain-containing histidine kinase [Lachnospiraceae bacterium]